MYRQHVNFGLVCQVELRIRDLMTERQQLTASLADARQVLVVMRLQAEKRKELQMHQATVDDCTKKISQL